MKTVLKNMMQEYTGAIVTEVQGHTTNSAPICNISAGTDNTILE